MVELSLEVGPEGQERAAGEALGQRSELQSSRQGDGQAPGSFLDRARPKGHVQCESWIWEPGLGPMGWASLSLGLHIRQMGVFG